MHLYVNHSRNQDDHLVTISTTSTITTTTTSSTTITTKNIAVFAREQRQQDTYWLLNILLKSDILHTHFLLNKIY